MCASLQASAISVGIIVLTYPGLMANRRDGDHHNNDGGDDVNNPVLTRAEFLNFHDENHQFCEKSQKIIGEIQQKLLLFLLGIHLTITMTNILKNAHLTTRKFHYLIEICVS